MNLFVRDFARFGLLCLHGGRWQDRQVIDPGLLKMAISSPISADTPLTSSRMECLTAAAAQDKTAQ